MVLIALFLIPFCAYAAPSIGLIAAFGAGIIVDLWYGLTLGQSALAFVAIAFVINWYKNKFSSTNSIFLFFFSVLTSLLLLVAQDHALTISLVWHAATSAVIMISAVLVISFVWKHIRAKEKKSY